MYTNNSKGIVVAATHHLEWLLPWWWHHYKAHNNLPVAFIDLGLSAPFKEWARDKGELISLSIPDCIVFPKEAVHPTLADKWQNLIGSGVWDVRVKWFKKPFAFKASPFSHSLWLDLDCEVRGPLHSLFTYLEAPVELALVREPLLMQQGLRALNLIAEKEVSYNSGVVLFKKEAPFLSLWEEEVLQRNHFYIGDQEALSRVLYNNPIPLHELAPEENWDRGLGPNPEALIFHWHGQKGKQFIQQEIDFLKKLSLL